MATGSCYLQVIPDTYPSGKIRKLVVAGFTQGEPTTIKPGARVIKLTLEIPDEQLMPIALSAKTDQLRMNDDYKAIIENLGKE